MITIHDAITDLHRIVYVEHKPQSTKRLDRLADYCVQELARRGLHGVAKEQTVPGIGRRKQWDVCWTYDHKVRLGISLKSVLRNLSGSIPNRLDDLMGEVANVQLHSPEIVVGYVMIINSDFDEDSKSAQWFRSRVQELSGRERPAWAAGMVEACVVAEASFEPQPMLMTAERDFEVFFDTLAEQVIDRNPGLQLGTMTDSDPSSGTESDPSIN